MSAIVVLSFPLPSARLLNMSQKTPFQLMREQHQSRIQAQKQAANYRAYAFKHGIAFVNQADLHAKMAEIEAEQQRVVLARKQEKERVIEERKQRISQQSVSYTPSPTPVTHDIAPSPSFTSSDGGGTSSSDGGTCSGGGGGSCD